MRFIFLLLVFIVFPLKGHSCFMEKFRWKNRVLVVNDKAPKNLIDKQKQKFANNDEANRDRDLILILSGKECDKNGLKFDFEPQTFKAHLVGKDGTVKATYNKPVAMDKVYKLIDSMPMRQKEILQSE